MLLTWEQDGTLNNRGKCNVNKGVGNGPVDVELKTYLTYDMGEHWTTLNVPSSFFHK